ncbi:MAG: alanine--tRNA ligase [Sedimentisphaerales bacterium]|nr:alanine--tRNA ligase [Sedimentisphaerales bacterium]
MLTAKEIRSSFIEFFKERGHTFVPSSPVVPIGDDTLLFTNAGMNQFKDIFLGHSVRDYKRAANSQKCIRVSGKHNDLEEVGRDTYHHTFFEMLGNWSFADYFKAESIQWAWELLTKVWGIDENRLWATVFAGDAKDGLAKDEEAAALWAKLTTLPAERVLAFGKKDNFWEMGETGPCGPCSEIHIDLGEGRCDKKDVPGHVCGVNAGCARFMELWNLVFIQYNRMEGGKLVPLAAKYVDTGAGLERVTAVLQKKTSNYDTDVFMPIIDAIGKLASRKYTGTLTGQTDIAFRVIADHIRSLVFSITDGATPSNEGRGYVIRRILRRASRFGRELGMHEPFMYKLVPMLAKEMGQAFPELTARADFVATVIEAEEASFGRTLDRGIEIFASAATRAEKAGNSIISGADAFQLYDTYGFPLDLTQLMARERNLNVDNEKFAELMQQQRTRARAAQKSSSMASLAGAELPHTDDWAKYTSDSCEATVVGFINAQGYQTSGQISGDENIGLVIDKTCFYAESGGQVGDGGEIETSSGQFVVEATEKIANCVVHRGTLAKGTMAVGNKVKVIVDKNRHSSKKNHTATHLLQWALQEVLGTSVRQQGSLVAPDYLRFDFTYPKALTQEELVRVEELVRMKIAADLPVTCPVMPIGEAKKLGAMALFNEKYGDEVRVVAIGARGEAEIHIAFSREFCGGTHVDSTGQIGGFKILSQESVSAGVRRITAFTGEGLAKYFEQRSAIVDDLAQLFKVPAEQIKDRVERLINENKKLAKDIKSASQKGSSDVMAQAAELLSKAEKIGGAAVIVGRIDAVDIEQARIAIDSLKKKAGSAAVILAMADGENVTLLAGVTDDLIAKGLKAGDIIKAIAPLVGGGGGGRPQMAQAGGKNTAGIDAALAKAIECAKAKLS